MKSCKYILSVLLLLYFSASSGQSVMIKGQAKALKNKVLYLYALDDAVPLAQIEIDSAGNFQKKIGITKSLEAMLRMPGLRQPFWVLLEAGKEIELTYVDSLLQFQVAAKNVGERLYNALHYSMNNFYANYGDAWQSWSPQTCQKRLDSLQRTRAAQIERAKDSLSAFEYHMLQHRNAVMVQSFLNYFGKELRQLPAKDPFYDFLDKIDLQDSLYKRSELLVFRKLEVAYLRQHKRIERVLDFVKFIDRQSIERELAQFYAAKYIQSQLQSPSYWEDAHPALDVVVLDSIQAFFKINHNPYTHFYTKAAIDFYQTQRGKPAPDFTAADAKLFNLSEHQGKVIFVYIWGRDCTVCEQQKQQVYKVLEFFNQSARFMGLVLNVDTDPSQWTRLIAKEDVLPSSSLQVTIAHGLQQSFVDQYAIDQVPRFIIIAANGSFYHADAPIDDLYRIINDALLQP